MVDVLQMLPVFLIVLGPPFVAGLRGWTWAGPACVGCWGALAIVGTLDEPAGYDMTGLGLKLFGAFAALALVALGVGMVVRQLRGRSVRRDPGPAESGPSAPE